MKQTKLFFIITAMIWMSVSLGCHPGYIVPNRVDVFVKKPINRSLKNEHLVIFPFKNPEKSLKNGIRAAHLTEAEISKKNVLQKITIPENSPWMFQLTAGDSIRQYAVSEARTQGASLALLGELQGVINGQTTETKMKLTILLISVDTNETVWWGKKSVVGKPGNMNLFLGKFFSPNPPAVEKLLAHSLKKMVSDIFESIPKEKKINFFDDFFDGFLDMFRSKKPFPYIKSAEEMDAAKMHNTIEPDDKLQDENDSSDTSSDNATGN